MDTEFSYDTWINDTASIFSQPIQYRTLPGTGGEPQECEAVPVEGSPGSLFILVFIYGIYKLYGNLKVFKK